MTFVSASILPGGYKNHTNADGTAKAIQITGAIYDSEIPNPWVGTYWIEGADLAALPSASHTPDQPQDARFQAIMGLVARFVKTTHVSWYSASLHGPTITARPDVEIAQLPVLVSGSIPGLL
jgi:hypothetical protein